MVDYYREYQLEMERHRKTWTQLDQVKGLLRCARTQLDDSGISNVLRGQIDAAISQQAEPKCDTCHGQGEVWTGANQHFGYMSMQPPEPIMEVCPECGGEAEPAPAQDERELPKAVAWLNKATQSVTTHQVQVMDWDDESEPVESLMTVAQHERIVELLTRPAQTEQQPVAMVDANDDGMWADILPDVSVKVGQMLYADPIVQTAQQPEQSGLTGRDSRHGCEGCK